MKGHVLIYPEGNMVGIDPMALVLLMSTNTQVISSVTGCTGKHGFFSSSTTNPNLIRLIPTNPQFTRLYF